MRGQRCQARPLLGRGRRKPTPNRRWYLPMRQPRRRRSNTSRSEASRKTLIDKRSPKTRSSRLDVRRTVLRVDGRNGTQVVARASGWSSTCQRTFVRATYCRRVRERRFAARTMQHLVLLQLAEENDVCLPAIERRSNSSRITSAAYASTRPSQPARHAERPHGRHVHRGVPDLARQSCVHVRATTHSLDPAAALIARRGVEDDGGLADSPRT